MPCDSCCTVCSFALQCKGWMQMNQLLALISAMLWLQLQAEVEEKMALSTTTTLSCHRWLRFRVFLGLAEHGAHAGPCWINSQAPKMFVSLQLFYHLCSSHWGVTRGHACRGSYTLNCRQQQEIGPVFLSSKVVSFSPPPQQNNNCLCITCSMIGHGNEKIKPVAWVHLEQDYYSHANYYDPTAAHEYYKRIANANFPSLCTICSTWSRGARNWAGICWTTKCGILLFADAWQQQIANDSPCCGLNHITFAGKSDPSENGFGDLLKRLTRLHELFQFAMSHKEANNIWIYAPTSHSIVYSCWVFSSHYENSTGNKLLISHISTWLGSSCRAAALQFCMPRAHPQRAHLAVMGPAY